MASNGPVLGIDIVARLDAFRQELKEIPDIGAKEARALTTQLSREIKKAEKEAKRAAGTSQKATVAQRKQAKETIASWRDIKSAIGPASKAAGVAGGVVVAGMVAGAAAVGLLVKSAFDLSGRLNALQKDADRVDMPVGEFEQTSDLFKLLTKDGVDAAQAIQDFQKQTGEAKPDLVALADELAAIENPADRGRRAMELFGEESGRKLAGALSQGGAAVRAAMDEIDRGGVATREQTRLAEELQDATFLVAREFEGFRRDVLVPLLPSLIDGAYFTRDLLAAMRESGLAEFAQGLSDVASGAFRAASALFGLDAVERQRQAASEEGQRAIQVQSDRIELLRQELEYEQLTADAVAELTGQQGYQTERSRELTGEIERQIGVLQRLRGELAADVPGMHTSTGPKSGAPSSSRRAGAGSAKKQERELQDLARAWSDLRSATDSAQMAELEGIDRLEAERDAAVAAHQARLASVLQLVEGDLDAQAEAQQVFAEGRLAIEQRAAAEIGSIRDAARQAELEALAQQREAEERVHQERLDEIREEEALRQRSLQGQLQAYSAFASSVGGMVSSIATAVAQGAEEGSEAQLQAMRTAWWAEQASALFQAGVNIPLAISNAVAGSPSPVMIPAMMALAGGAAGAAFAGVAVETAMGPPFHSGGVVTGSTEQLHPLLPEEGVANRSGMAAMGGPEALHAYNRGEQPASQGPLLVISQVNNRTSDAATYEQVRRPDSELATYVRATQGKRTGSARVWS